MKAFPFFRPSPRSVVRILPFILVFMAGPVSAADPTDPPAGALGPDEIALWVEVMRTNLPALAAAGERSRAASLNADGVRRFADPKFLVGGTVYTAQGMNPSEEGNLIYGVEQPLPIMGKETAARRKEDAQAGVEAARTELVFQEARRDLTVALFEAALSRRSLELGEADLDALRSNLAAAEARFRSAEGTTVDVLRLQSEFARRTAEVRNSGQVLAAAQAGVNRWLGRSPEVPLPSFSLPDPASPLSVNEKLIQLALRSEASLKLLDRERIAAESSLTASRRQRRPDLGLGITGRQYSGDGEFRQGQFVLSVSLPWFNRGRYRKDIQRDVARVEAVRLDTTDRELGLREEIFRLTTRIDAERRTALSYHDEIVPQSEAAHRAALDAWTSGRGTLTDVLDTRRARLTAQVEEARAVAAQWSALGELVLCCGLGDLESLLQFSSVDSGPPAPGSDPAAHQPRI